LGFLAFRLDGISSSAQHCDSHVVSRQSFPANRLQGRTEASVAGKGSINT
jgi:hypothetical protein